MWVAVVRPSAWLIVYNVPIFVPFFGLGWEVLLARRWRRDVGVFAVWLLGGMLLAARFAGLAPVSGHVAWCVLMAVHARRRSAPMWVGIAISLVSVETLVFKIVWLSWLDSLLGALAGATLAAMLVATDQLAGSSGSV
ncbi:MAG: hypothetical protein OER88_07400 [Planctomycetota bacterium]|nr:hypothetical protein [Planctomycetota bacterium]